MTKTTKGGATGLLLGAVIGVLLQVLLVLSFDYSSATVVVQGLLLGGFGATFGCWIGARTARGDVGR